MVSCSVFGCRKRTIRDAGVSFYRFPRINTKDMETEKLSRKRFHLWLSRVKRADLTPEKIKNSRVCSLHFIKGKPANLYDETNPDWAPSLALGYDFAGSRSAHSPSCGNNLHIKDEIVEESDGVMNTDIPVRNEHEDYASDIDDDEEENVNVRDSVCSDFKDDSSDDRVSSTDVAPESGSNSKPCVIFVPKTCTFEGASPVINGKSIDLGHLKESGLIKNTMYILTDFLTDSQTKIPVYRPSLDIEECEKVLNAPPIKMFRKKRYLGNYKEEDLFTPELKQLYEIATNKVNAQSKTISILKKKNFKLRNKISLLSQKLKYLEKRSSTGGERSILTEECASAAFCEDDQSTGELSTEDSNECQIDFEPHKSIPELQHWY